MPDPPQDLAAANHSPPPTLSVLVATRDRAAKLARLLASLEAEAPELLEVAVVDNGSRDGTGELLQRWSSTRPWARRLRHAAPGKSGALNAALADARGAWVGFVDDDVEVRPGWARALRAAAGAHGAVALQGRILPPAAALADGELMARWRRLGTLPYVDLGEGLAERRALTGANIAVSRPALVAVGGFDERLGPGAAGLSEDTDLARRLREAGGRILYVGGAVVEHELDPERLSDAYFDAYHRRLGKSRLIQDHKSLWTSVLPNFALASLQAGVVGLVSRGAGYYRKRGRRVAYGAMLAELAGRRGGRAR